MIDMQSESSSPNVERRHSDRRSHSSSPTARDSSPIDRDADRRVHSRRVADTLERIRALEHSIAAASSSSERQLLSDILENYRAWHHTTRGL